MPFRTALHPAGPAATTVFHLSGKYDPIPSHYSSVLQELIASALTVKQEDRPSSEALVAQFFGRNTLDFSEAQARVIIRNEEKSERRTLDIYAQVLMPLSSPF